MAWDDDEDMESLKKELVKLAREYLANMRRQQTEAPPFPLLIGGLAPFDPYEPNRALQALLSIAECLVGGEPAIPDADTAADASAAIYTALIERVQKLAPKPSPREQLFVQTWQHARDAAAEQLRRVEWPPAESVLTMADVMPLLDALRGVVAAGNVLEMEVRGIRG